MISQEIKGQWCLTTGEEVQHSMSFQDSIKINPLLLRDGFETTAFMDPDAMVRHKELLLKLCSIHNFMLIFILF